MACYYCNKKKHQSEDDSLIMMEVIVIFGWIIIAIVTAIDKLINPSKKSGLQSMQGLERAPSDKAKRSEKKASKWKSGCLCVFIGFIILSVLSAPYSTSRRTSSNRTTYAARTQNPRTATYYVTSPNPHVRACPSTTCSSNGGLLRGDRIQALGRIVGEKPEGYSSHTWVKFRHGGAVAYIHSSLVSTRRPNS